MEKNSALHEGHRQRLKERFLRDPDAIADHELLEMLLFYAIPRRDTNDLAHTLIEEFGSLLGVLEADNTHLSNIMGVKASTVTYIKALCETSRRFMAGKLNGGDSDAVFDTPDRIARFLWPRFLGLTEERVYALLFDNGMRLLDCYHVCDGSVASAPFSVRRIVQRAYTKGAVGVVLAHNHPGGVVNPSTEDIAATRHLEEALRMMEIPLIEHYIFAENSFMPIMNQCRLGEEQQYVASSLQEVLQGRLNQIKRK